MVDKAAKKPGPNDPTGAQSAALGDAVARAYKKGWDGKLRSKFSPILIAPSWNGSGVPLGTRTACVRKGLCERIMGAGSGNYWVLTETGVEAGLVFYARLHDGAHPKADAQAEAKRQKEIKAKKNAKVKLAKHLFRGLKRERGENGEKAMSAAITAGGEVRLNLDDLIVLGEGIEKLRS